MNSVVLARLQYFISRQFTCSVNFGRGGLSQTKQLPSSVAALCLKRDFQTLMTQSRQDKFISELQRVLPSAIHVNAFVGSDGAFCFHSRVKGIHSQGPWCFLPVPSLKAPVSNYIVNPIEQLKESEFPKGLLMTPRNCWKYFIFQMLRGQFE